MSSKEMPVTTPDRSWPKLSAANLIPVLALAIFGTLLARHVSALDGAQIRAAFANLTTFQWIAALVFTAFSFRAIGLYDIIMHRVLRTGQSTRTARAAGIKAIALSQTLGFGILTSALVRWRCLPDFSPANSLRLSASVSLSFLAALAVVTAIVVPLSGLIASTGPLVVSGLAAAAGLVLLARLAHRLGWLPGAVTNGTLLALLLTTAADTAFAAAALWVLWPDPIAFHHLFAAYLIALGAGLLSNAPGGVGAFDLSLLALLPITDDASAMAALLAFRILYYALPASLALIGLIRPTPRTPRGGLTHPEQSLALQTADIIEVNETPVLTLPCWGRGAVLGNLPAPLSINDLHPARTPTALYKCSAKQAVSARTRGWAVLRCASDAILDVQTWDTSGPNRRQLRRALRAFASSGLHIREVRNPLLLATVASDWAQSHGGERGHSMGRFCPNYLKHQRVFAAFEGATPVAFISFHTGPLWTLDLMRHTANLPNGVMQALVCAGIDAAKAVGAQQLSLACVPAPAPNFPFADHFITKAAGLIRFKSAFGPTWQPRYICARNWPQLVMTMFTLAYSIHRPDPLPATTNPAQKNSEDFSFAPWPAPCDAHTTQTGARVHVQSSFETP